MNCVRWVSCPFLPVYAWVGLWTALFTIILAVTDASFLMRYFTRFTDETFSALISLIFISQAVKALYHEFDDVGETGPYDAALLSLLLALGHVLRGDEFVSFRRSSYLRPWMREFMADFGPSIALVSMAAVAYWFDQVELEPLPAPETFGTTSGRPWTIDLNAAPMWTRFAAAGPALLVAVLVYLDQNITARL